MLAINNISMHKSTAWPTVRSGTRHGPWRTRRTLRRDCWTLWHRSWGLKVLNPVKIRGIFRGGVCLFAWGLTALSAQIGYIAP